MNKIYIIMILLVILPSISSAQTITIHSIGMGEATIATGSWHVWQGYVQDGSSCTFDVAPGEIMYILDFNYYDDNMLGEYSLVTKIEITTNSTEYWVTFPN